MRKHFNDSLQTEIVEGGSLTSLALTNLNGSLLVPDVCQGKQAQQRGSLQSVSLCLATGIHATEANPTRLSAHPSAAAFQESRLGWKAQLET